MAKHDSNEAKLDEDFLFYLTFAKTSLGILKIPQEKALCEAWLQKLCGEAAIGEDSKRTRNVYLSHLVLEMQEGRLMPPFLEYPPEGKLPLAVDVFGPESSSVKEPPWLHAIAEGTGADFIHSSKDGRTYLASRYLNDGKGAFSYMAISVADQEPLFVPLSEGGEVISQASDGGSQSSFRTKSQESLTKKPTRVSITQLPFTYEQTQRGCPTQDYGGVCPAAQPNSPPVKIEKAPSYINVAVSQDIQGHTALDDTKHVEVTKSIQRLLSRRRSPEARNALLTFYDTVIEDIDAELRGEGERNKHVDLLYKKVEEGLKGQLSYLTPEMKSRRILTILKNKLENRKKEVEKRVRALDEIEAIVHPGDEAGMFDPSLDQSAVGSMWKNVVQQLPKPRSIKLLQNLYHPDVVDLFLKLLVKERQMIMTRFEQQHNNKITALKSELNQEVTEGFYHYKIARDAWVKVAKVLEQVQNASAGVENKKYESAEDYEDDVLRYQMEVNHEKVSKALKEEYTEAEARHKYELKRSDDLSKQIEAEVERMTMSETLNEEGLQRIQADAEALQLEINKLTQDIELQTQRIVELNTLIGA